VRQDGGDVAAVSLANPALDLGGVEALGRFVDHDHDPRHLELTRDARGDAGSLVVLLVGTHDDQ
jgi:hypothetical protein